MYIIILIKTIFFLFFLVANSRHNVSAKNQVFDPLKHIDVRDDGIHIWLVKVSPLITLWSLDKNQGSFTI